MIIASDRLLLRPMAPKDIDQFVRCLGDWEVQQWLTIPPFPYERSDGEAYLAIVQRNHATSHPTVFVTADAGTDDAIGTASVDIGADGTGELGYWLARSHWGRGLMKDAVALFWVMPNATLLFAASLPSPTPRISDRSASSRPAVS